MDLWNIRKIFGAIKRAEKKPEKQDFFAHYGMFSRTDEKIMFFTPPVITRTAIALTGDTFFSRFPDRIICSGSIQGFLEIVGTIYATKKSTNSGMFEIFYTDIMTNVRGSIVDAIEAFRFVDTVVSI